MTTGIPTLIPQKKPTIASHAFAKDGDVRFHRILAPEAFTDNSSTPSDLESLRCRWQFTIPAGLKVDLLCSRFDLPCSNGRLSHVYMFPIRVGRLCSVDQSRDALLSFWNQGSRSDVLRLTYRPRSRGSNQDLGLDCVLAEVSGGPGLDDGDDENGGGNETGPGEDFSSTGCGIKGGRKIVGGQEATAHEWPWMVALTLSTPQGTFFCGGSVINNRTVLTAAHCVDGVIQATAYFGCVARRQDCDQIRVVEQADILGHQSYGNLINGNDIALLKLPTAVQFNAKVRPVCLPTTRLQANQTLWVTGWGKTATTGQLAMNLKEAELNLQTDSYCRRFYGSSLASSFLCTTQRSGASCQGDSGSFVGQDNDGDGLWTQDGVVSFGGSSLEVGDAGQTFEGDQRFALFKVVAGHWEDEFQSMITVTHGQLPGRDHLEAHHLGGPSRGQHRKRTISGPTKQGEHLEATDLRESHNRLTGRTPKQGENFPETGRSGTRATKVGRRGAEVLGVGRGRGRGHTVRGGPPNAEQAAKDKRSRHWGHHNSELGRGKPCEAFQVDQGFFIPKTTAVSLHFQCTVLLHMNMISTPLDTSLHPIEGQTRTLKACLNVQDQRRTVFNVKKRLDDGEDLSEAPRSGRPRKLSSEHTIDVFKEQPELSMDVGVSRSTVSRRIKESKGISLRALQVPLLTAVMVQKRQERSKFLLNQLKHQAAGKVIVFSASTVAGFKPS
eukprot:snap_masked-scaffold203_size261420-processed-gene-1.2 protein:Tk10416 transcript:snap_masked-scaffold203_size261420-processed-gene-1.2-mRNA-1 annotation:"transmembrane protease serine 9-like"